MRPLPEYILEARIFAAAKNFDSCAEILIDNLTENKPKVKRGLGLTYLQTIIPNMIGMGMYGEVAHILWGSELFNPEPESVSLIWDEIQKTSTLLIQGGGSLGKSYSLAAWLLLDWLEDPLWTCIKVVSVTSEHAMRNVFAHIKNLHRHSAIPLPGTVKANSIQASNDEKQGIHLVAIPAGEDGSGRLQGFHPVPRPTPHPKYKTLSRVRAILDEAEEIPGGVWPDIDNMLITADGTDHVKVAAAANPRDLDSKFGKRCEPENGWDSVDIEDSIQWKSKLGWSVVRLDGARCENVIQNKLIYPGFVTWEGYRRYLLAGDSSPEYFTMARGWFPAKGLNVNVIPRDFMSRAIGRMLFTGPVTYVASVDLAFEGGDKAVMTVGRFGLSLGYSVNGINTMFDKPKYGLQAEIQFELLKDDPEIDPAKKKTQTVFLADQIKKNCKDLAIKPYWVIVDRTGNGTGVHDLLMTPSDGMGGGYLGPEVVGIHYGSGATDLKMFADSTEKASDLYDGIVTELFFATRNYLEFDYLKISPSMNVDVLTEELCSRRFKPSRKTKIEGKKEYKARGNSSPDRADSLTMMVHLVRMREGFEASMLEVSGSREVMPELGEVDTLRFLNFHDD